MTEMLEGKRSADILAATVIGVFADMAFIDVRTISVDTNSDLLIHPGTTVPDSEQCAVIDVLMPLSCRIELKVNVAIRNRIVETLFGDFPPAERKKMAEDSLLEMLNIISGSFLSSYFGADTTIQLELPRILYITESPVGQSVARIAMDAEGIPMSVILTSVRYRY